MTLIILYGLLAAPTEVKKNDISKINKYKNALRDAILQHESGNRHYNDDGSVVRGKAGEIGRYQLTSICILTYQCQVNINIKRVDAFNELTNRIIGEWYFNKCYDAFDNDEYRANAYNRGILATRNGVWNNDYVNCVIFKYYYKITNRFLMDSPIKKAPALLWDAGEIYN